MSDSPSYMNYFWLNQLGPNADDKCCEMRVKGLNARYDQFVFYRENMKSSPYQFYAFGGGGRYHNANFNFKLPAQIGGFHVTKPSIYFVGAYKFRDIDSKTFDVDRTKTPTEKETLQKILPMAKGTEWEPRLREYLKKLK